MTATRTIEAGELSTDAIITALKQGQRLQVAVELLGQSHQITLRYDGEIYYCETPTRLHKHSDETAMRACIEERGYAAAPAESA
jgi:hemin uptake protein HemP